jgi:hypothetical protein
MNQRKSLAKERLRTIHPLFRKLYLVELPAEEEANGRRVPRHKVKIIRSS